MPQVTIIEPPSGKRERIVLNFGRTLVNDSNEKKFTFENVGVIPAKVIVEIYDILCILYTFLLFFLNWILLKNNQRLNIFKI